MSHPVRYIGTFGLVTATTLSVAHLPKPLARRCLALAKRGSWLMHNDRTASTWLLTLSRIAANLGDTRWSIRLKHRFNLRRLQCPR